MGDVATRAMLPARPTPRLRKRITTALKEGVTPDTAADACRITWPVLQKWIDTGIRLLEQHAEGVELTREERAYAMLVIDIREAMASFDLEAVTAIKEHGAKRSQSWEWLLERTRQERYAKPLRMTVGNANNEPLRISVEHMNTLTIDALREGRKALENLRDSEDIIEGDAVEV